MKKFLLVTVLIAMAASMANAQIVKSQSRSITRIVEDKIETPKTNYPLEFLVKVGGGMMFTSYSYENLAAYNVSLGCQKQLNDNGIYAGAQLGSSMIGYDGKDWGNHSFYGKSATIYVGPVLGLRKPVGTGLKFDAHIGASFEYAFASDDDGDDHYRPAAEFGLGIWFNNFLVELEYRGSYIYVRNNGVFLNFGFKF